MKKNILGLDIGTNSIGWAVINTEIEKILGTGVIIFPEGAVDKGSSKEQSKNAERRLFRQARVGYYRHKNRRSHLLKTLIEFNMCPLTLEEVDEWIKYDKSKGCAGKKFPDSPNFRQWIKLNPYKLRAKALEEDLSLEELGRIFYHMIQRRGFLSNRKSKEDGAIFKGKDAMVGITETMQQIEDNTLGQFLYSIYPEENHPYHNITNQEGNPLRIRARYTLRDMYIAEFEKIWKRQAEPLGLDKLQKKITKTYTLSGSLGSKRNKKRIERLKKSKDKEHFKISGNKLTIEKYISLKEHLGGNIDYSEDGTLKHKSQESVLFFQLPLRSQKRLLSKCSLESKPFWDKANKTLRTVGPSPCPLSHPEFEEFRSLQFINNIEYGTKQKLNQAQREQLLALFNKKDASFNFDKLSKELKLSYETFNFAGDFKVVGNYTTAKLGKLFKPAIWEAYKEQIWHCFYFYEDNDKLTKKLAKDFDLQEKHFAQISKISLKDGYANLSLKAIRNITPFLRKGYRYSDAVILGGVRNAFKAGNIDRWQYFEKEHNKIEKDIINIIRQKNKEGEAIERIKKYLYDNEYGFEKNDKNFQKLYHHSQEIREKQLNPKLSPIENLRNPIVQKGLSEMRRLVNRLIDQYGSFDMIKVELGRDLKAGKEKRIEAQRRINENNKKNEEARDKLREYGLASSKENIHKYLLWKELEDKNPPARCPYTNKVIGINEVLGSGNKFQIEHIFPRSLSLDNRFSNKTLCDSKFNGLKGNRTPYQFYQENNDSKLWGGAQTWDEVKHRAFKILPYAKAKRFCSEKNNQIDGFIERQLNDTRYMSKKAVEILSEICDRKNIRVFPGELTAELRHLWGLNNILNPVEVIDLKDAEINEKGAEKHWLILDKDDKVISIQPVNNRKPSLEKNETLITGILKNGTFSSFNLSKTSRYEDLKDEKHNGKYWKKIKISEQPLLIERKYTPCPETGVDEIVLSGKITNKKFENNNLGKINAANNPEGEYWAKFKVRDIKFSKSGAKEQLKKKKDQILLYGNIKDGAFKSYMYECRTAEADGYYGALLRLDTTAPEFIERQNEKPETDADSLCIQGTINKDGIFQSDSDNQHSFPTHLSSGKYWAVFKIIGKNPELFPQINPEPKIKKDQNITEGTIWVDKYTGEIKFDPKKNRDDHRHHAIDAMTIALTNQSFLQKLSTYNARLDDKLRGKSDKPQFAPPWSSFYKDAKEAAEKILIVHRTTHNNKLHKETIYGKRQSPGETVPTYRTRKKVEEITTDKQIAKIVDERVRKIIAEAKKKEKILKTEVSELEKLKKKEPTESGQKLLEQQIEEKKQAIKRLYTMPNKNGEPVPIRKVRIEENIGNAVALKDSKILTEKSGNYERLNQHVNPRNNHHVAIYKDSKGKYFEKMVSFWETVERKKQGLSIIDKDPKDGSTFVVSLQINDMFLIGINENEINWENPDYAGLSKYLYRVQKISSKNYVFRHHLASTLNNSEQYFNIGGANSFKTHNPIKVKINNLGEIQKYEEKN